MSKYSAGELYRFCSTLEAILEIGMKNIDTNNEETNSSSLITEARKNVYLAEVNSAIVPELNFELKRFLSNQSVKILNSVGNNKSLLFVNVADKEKVKSILDQIVEGYEKFIPDSRTMSDINQTFNQSNILTISHLKQEQADLIQNILTANGVYIAVTRNKTQCQISFCSAQTEFVKNAIMSAKRTLLNNKDLLKECLINNHINSDIAKNISEEKTFYITDGLKNLFIKVDKNGYGFYEKDSNNELSLLPSIDADNLFNTGKTLSENIGFIIEQCNSCFQTPVLLNEEQIKNPIGEIQNIAKAIIENIVTRENAEIEADFQSVISSINSIIKEAEEFEFDTEPIEHSYSKNNREDKE